METAEVQKIECPHFRSPSSETSERRRVRTGLPPVEYMRTPEPPPPAPDKTAIAAAIKAGEEVPERGWCKAHGLRSANPTPSPHQRAFLRLPMTDYTDFVTTKLRAVPPSGYHAPG